MISRTAAYAMEAALAIAQQPDGEPARAGELAERLGLPGNYLAKILNSLAHGGILSSGRGPTGGFTLSRDATDITVEDIISRFDDVGTSRRCFLGRGQCSDIDSCPMHEDWKRVSAPIFDFFHETTLAELITHRGRRTTRTKPRPRAGHGAKKSAHPGSPAARKPRSR